MLRHVGIQGFPLKRGPHAKYRATTILLRMLPYSRPLFETVGEIALIRSTTLGVRRLAKCKALRPMSIRSRCCRAGPSRPLRWTFPARRASMGSICSAERAAMRARVIFISEH